MLILQEFTLQVFKSLSPAATRSMAAGLPTGVSRDDASLVDKVASRLPEIGLRALANLKFKIESGLVDVNRYGH